MVPEGKIVHANAHDLTTAEYMNAFKEIVQSDSIYIRMLQFHYRKHEKTTTPALMAKAMKFNDPGASHLHYGRLGRLVGQHLHLPPDYKVEALAHFRYPDPERICHWEMRGRVAEALERLGWVTKSSDRVSKRGRAPEKIPLFEGALTRALMTRQERNPKARRACLAHYGAWCIICGFNFKAAYGPTAEGFIHVHHVETMKGKRKKHEIDPIRDLRPVCPNCHSVIHIKARPHTINEVKEMVDARRPPGWLGPSEVREARLRQPGIRFTRASPSKSGK